MLRVSLACLLAGAAFAQKAGEPAPPITLKEVLQAPPGASANWAGLKGKAVVLEFWATWCAPCVAEIPHLNQLAEKFKDRPLQFISITDEDKPVVEKFLRARQIAGWVALDDGGATFKAYRAVGRPHTVLVDANGIIRAVTLPTAVNEAAIEDLLAGKTPNLPARTFSSEPVTREAGPPPYFEVLIRPGTHGGSSRGSRNAFEASGMPLRWLIAAAWEVPPIRVAGPEWIDKAEYDAAVAAPDGAESQKWPLLRQALETTFKLKLRREQRDTDVLVLTAPKGATPGLVKPATSGSMSRTSPGKGDWINSPLSNLAALLERSLSKPVLDETGLTETYDFRLTWDAKDPESLISAVREQLGLEVTPERRPLEFLVVEAAEQPKAR